MLFYLKQPIEGTTVSFSTLYVFGQASYFNQSLNGIFQLDTFFSGVVMALVEA